MAAKFLQLLQNGLVRVYSNFDILEFDPLNIDNHRDWIGTQPIIRLDEQPDEQR